MDEDSAEFIAESDRTLLYLKHWATIGLEENSRTHHMNVAREIPLDKSSQEVDTLAWMLQDEVVVLGGEPEPQAEPVPHGELALEAGSGDSGGSGSSSSGSSSSSSSRSSDSDSD
jgi:hypothetical protein